VGYEDGRISIYDLDDEQFVCSLDLHKSTVSSIDVDENDTKMISAGLDGNIFVWDLLSEESQKMYYFNFKFSKSAHGNGITQIIYKNLIIGNKPVDCIMSLGKDGFFKIWNADSLICMHAVSTQTTEAFSMVFNE
jgi:WD40 repeat protein